MSKWYAFWASRGKSGWAGPFDDEL